MHHSSSYVSLLDGRLDGVRLEVEAQLHGFAAWRYVVRAAERGQEIVQGGLVGQVDNREAQAPLVPVAVEEVVLAHGGVEQVSRRNARWILVVILGPRRGNGNVLGTVTRRGAQIGAERRADGSCGRRQHAAAEQPCLELLIGRYSRHVDEVIGATTGWAVRTRLAAETRHGTRDQAAVVAPVEAKPRPSLPRLILDVRGLVEVFIVVDAKHRRSPWRGANAADLRSEDTRRHP